MLREMTVRLRGHRPKNDSLRAFREGIRAWQQTGSEESETERLLRELTDRIVVRPDQSAVFHLKCGLAFLENM